MQRARCKIIGETKLVEELGATRDVVQNHLLQLVALLAMEAPGDGSAAALQQERAKVLKAIEPVDPLNIVRGQYAGYLQEPGVAANSEVETYTALRINIESLRWAGVPFYIRTGKCLPVTATEAVVEFRRQPPLPFVESGKAPHPNHLRFRIGADDGVDIELQTKQPGDRTITESTVLSVSYENVFGRRSDAYERLLAEAIEGDQMLFLREDAVEEAWRIVEPALDLPESPEVYEPGSWGPKHANRIPAGVVAWHNPSGG